MGVKPGSPGKITALSASILRNSSSGKSNTTSLIMLGSWTRIFHGAPFGCCKTGCRTRRPGFGRPRPPRRQGGGDKIVVDHSSAGEIMLNDRRDLALGLFGLVLKMQVGKVSSSHKVFLSVSLPPSARQTPPTRGGRWRLRQKGSGSPAGRRERTSPLPEIFRTAARFSPPPAAAGAPRRGGPRRALFIKHAGWRSPARCCPRRTRSRCRAG